MRVTPAGSVRREPQVLDRAWPVGALFEVVRKLGRRVAQALGEEHLHASHRHGDAASRAGPAPGADRKPHGTARARIRSAGRRSRLESACAAATRTMRCRRDSLSQRSSKSSGVMPAAAAPMSTANAAPAMLAASSARCSLHAQALDLRFDHVAKTFRHSDHDLLQWLPHLPSAALPRDQASLSQMLQAQPP